MTGGGGADAIVERGSGDMRRQQRRVRDDHRGVRRHSRIADTANPPVLDRLTQTQSRAAHLEG